MSSQEQPHVTLSDVAERAGVSRSTASIAFSGAGPVSEATRARVRAAADELGYSGPDPRARSLRQGRSGVVGIVFDESLLTAFRDPVNVGTLDGIASGLGADSNGLLLLTETGAVGTGIQSAAIDAAVLMGCSPAFERIVAALGRRGIPLVSIEGGGFEGVVDVALENAAASEQLAAHLHGLGHRRVGMVTLATDARRETGLLTPARESRITTVVAADRLQGGRRVFPSLVASTASFNVPEDGARAAAVLLDVPEAERPTAILAQSDLLAVGVIREAEARGLAVPRDLSVTGFDGVRIDGLDDYDLTTMRQPVGEKGRAAGLAVAQLLAGSEEAAAVSSVVFGCAFHRGDTTAAPAR